MNASNLMEKAKYLFGDSDLAARRLELLAQVFEESTRGFLIKAAGGPAWGLPWTSDAAPDSRRGS
jgi:hypothetical protein